MASTASLSPRLVPLFHSESSIPTWLRPPDAHILMNATRAAQSLGAIPALRSRCQTTASGSWRGTLEHIATLATTGFTTQPHVRLPVSYASESNNTLLQNRYRCMEARMHFYRRKATRTLPYPQTAIRSHKVSARMRAFRRGCLARSDVLLCIECLHRTSPSAMCVRPRRRPFSPQNVRVMFASHWTSPRNVYLV